jgi:hypothetical protein
MKLTAAAPEDNAMLVVKDFLNTCQVVFSCFIVL